MIMWKKISRTDGVRFVLPKPNKRSFFNQQFQLTNVEDNTNVQFVEKQHGYKVDVHQLKVYTSLHAKK